MDRCHREVARVNLLETGLGREKGYRDSSGLGLSGYWSWKSETNSDAWPSSLASSQEVSSSVPS